MGSGTFVQSGGTNNAVGVVYAGFGPTGMGTYQITAGSIVTPELTAGVYGTGVVNQSGGTASLSRMYLGYYSGGTGTINLSGTGSISSVFADVGVSGTGLVTQTGGDADNHYQRL